MRPTSPPLLVLIAVICAGVGALLAQSFASSGSEVPVAGWLSGGVLLALAAVLVALGLPLRRYLRESEERREHPTLTPRRHQLDLPTAFRVVLLARSAAYTGAVVGGIFLGQGLYLVRGGGDPVAALLPTGFAALSALVLAVVGVIVERWGRLPPDDSSGAAESSGVPSPRA